MSRRIRVLEMIDEASLGGGQMHVLLLAKHLSKEEFDVTIATEPKGFLVDESARIGIPTVPVSMSNTLSVQTLTAVRRILKAGSYDVLHTHGGTAGFWGRAVAVLSRSPRAMIHTYHGLHYFVNGENVRRFRIVDKTLLPFTTKIVCVCESDRAKAIASKVADEVKTVVVRNGIEVDRFAVTDKRGSIRSSLSVKENDFVFGNIGRLHRQKGQTILLRAFQKVVDQHSNTWLWLIGDGELRNGLELLAGRLGIAERVRFLGGRKDVADLLPALDVFVLPSLWEGQPIALLEAMAAGVPVVASNVDGIPEVVENGTSGLLVDVNSVNSLASSMSTLMANSQLRSTLAHNGRERIVKQFTVDHMALCMGDLYKKSVS